MKNYFCVGQKVIRLEDRKTTTLLHVSDKIVIDSEHNTLYLHQVQALEDYLDPTNYFYHHSRFGKGQEMANNGFSSLLFVREERDELIKFETETGNLRPTFHRMLDEKQKEAEEMIERGLMIKRTAEYNLNQWGSGDHGKVM